MVPLASGRGRCRVGDWAVPGERQRRKRGGRPPLFRQFAEEEQQAKRPPEKSGGLGYMSFVWGLAQQQEEPPPQILPPPLPPQMLPPPQQQNRMTSRMMIQQQLPPPRIPLLLHIQEPPRKIACPRSQAQFIVCAKGAMVPRIIQDGHRIPEIGLVPAGRR